MQNLDMQTPDITSMNIEKIWQLFPNVITEKEDENWKITKAIDFELLKQQLSKEIVEDCEERYTLNWPWKKASLLKANTPINKTLRPVREDSVNFDTTENLYLEWDNFEVLKILQESYLWKVKMIYIDPPYNTWKDFVYRDNFKVSKDEYEDDLWVEDEEGWKLFKNTDTNGRFHSDWLSMMYERLTVARDLLKDDWVIFMSIDDNEVHNLRKIADEIFGEENFVAQIIIEWTPKNDPYIVSTAHEYAIVYTKNFELAKTANYWITLPIYDKILNIFENNDNNFDIIEDKLKELYKKEKVSSDNIANYKYADINWIYRIWPIDDPQSSWPKDERINPKTWKPCKIPNWWWRCTPIKWEEWKKNNLILFPDSDDNIPSKKTYITRDRLDVLKAHFKIQTRKDTDFLKNLFWLSMTPFSNPKPQLLLKEFIKNTNDKNWIYLDFFAGSWSFWQAIIDVNKEDNWNRKFILVQLDEKIEITWSWKEKKISESAISFLKSINKPCNIAELSKERIRRAGKKIIEENKEELEKRETPLDTWFRVYKTDSSNMKDVFYHPSELKQSSLLDIVSNIKEDRSSEDLLTQVILDLGLTLDMPIEKKEILGNTVYFVAGNSLVACFDENVDFGIVDEIAKEEPLRVVFRDSCFKTDSDRINFENRFKKLSGESDIRVI